MISRSTFQSMVSPGLLRIFDEVYGAHFLGGDTIEIKEPRSGEGSVYNFIDTVFMDEWPVIVGPQTWLW